MVAKSADRCRDAGLSLSQTSPRFVGRVGPDGRAQGRIVGTGQLDFVGDLRGRLVTFDAKSSRHTTRLDLRLIRRHQAVILKRAHQRGAVAFLLVELGAGTPAPVYFALPWPALAPWWGAADYGGAQSMPRAAIEAEGLPIQRTGKTLLLLPVVEALAARVAG
jgi:penicillin-binding protein-related factor A (putative recombinase)